MMLSRGFVNNSDQRRDDAFNFENTDEFPGDEEEIKIDNELTQSE